LKEHEYDLEGKIETISEVVNALRTYKSYDEMCNNFPDIKA